MDRSKTGSDRPFWQPDRAVRRRNLWRTILVVAPIVLLMAVIGVLVLMLFACILTSGYTGNLSNVFKAFASVDPAEPYSVYLSGSGGRLLKIDPRSDDVLASVRLGSGIGDMAVSPDGNRLYVSNGRKLTIINTRDGSTLDNVTFGREVVLAEASPDGRRLYVNYQDPDAPGDVAFVDSSSYDVIATVKNVPFSWGMAVSPDGKYLYMSDYWGGRLTVIDTEKAAVVKSISCTPAESIYGTSYWNGHAYASGGQAADVAVSPDGKWVYVSMWSANHLAIINTDTLSLEDIVDMRGRSSSGVAASPDGRYVYLSCCDANSLLVIDAASMEVEDRILTGKCPRHIRLTPDGRYLYIFSEDAPVAKFDTSSRVVSPISGIYGSNAAFPAK